MRKGTGHSAAAIEPAAVREAPARGTRSQRYRRTSVLVVSTLAFTVCFMVWMMFGVIGIPIRKTLGLNGHRVRHPHRDAGAHRLADPRAAGHVDRQVRRPHRDLRADARRA